jgi:hypothetical protein
LQIYANKKLNHILKIDNCHCKDLLDKYEEEHAGEPVQREFINMKAPTKKRGKKRKNVVSEGECKIYLVGLGLGIVSFLVSLYSNYSPF